MAKLFTLLCLVLSTSAYADSSLFGTYAVKSTDECVDAGKKAVCDTHHIEVKQGSKAILLFEIGTTTTHSHELVEFSNDAVHPEDVAMAVLQVSADSIRWNFINNPSHLSKIIHLHKNPRMEGEYFLLVQNSLSNDLSGTSQRIYTLRKE